MDQPTRRVNGEPVIPHLGPSAEARRVLIEPFVNGVAPEGAFPEGTTHEDVCPVCKQATTIAGIPVVGVEGIPSDTAYFITPGQGKGDPAVFSQVQLPLTWEGDDS